MLSFASRIPSNFGPNFGMGRSSNCVFEALALSARNNQLGCWEIQIIQFNLNLSNVKICLSLSHLPASILLIRFVSGLSDCCYFYLSWSLLMIPRLFHYGRVRQKPFISRLEKHFQSPVQSPPRPRGQQVWALELSTTFANFMVPTSTSKRIY